MKSHSLYNESNVLRGQSARHAQKIKAGDKDRKGGMSHKQNLKSERRIRDAEVAYLNSGSGRLIREDEWEDMQLAFDLGEGGRGGEDCWSFQTCVLGVKTLGD